MPDRNDKPTAFEINACTERLCLDSHRLPFRDGIAARRVIRNAIRAMPDSAERAFGTALRAMRYNPRAFALAALIGQHCP